MYNDERVKKTMFAEMGKYCLDLSKLVFGGVILTAIMDLDVSKSHLILMGILAVVIFASVGALGVYLTINKNV